MSGSTAHYAPFHAAGTLRRFAGFGYAELTCGASFAFAGIVGQDAALVNALIFPSHLSPHKIAIPRSGFPPYVADLLPVVRPSLQVVNFLGFAKSFSSSALVCDQNNTERLQRVRTIGPRKKQIPKCASNENRLRKGTELRLTGAVAQWTGGRDRNCQHAQPEV